MGEDVPPRPAAACDRKEGFCMQELAGRVRAAADRYRMISPGDRIAVGVSGGKDSLALLCLLAELRRYYPAPFTLTALSADPCFGGVQSDYSGIAELCRRLEVPFFVRRTALGKIIFEERREKNPCSLCARMRRGILHNMAKEQSCNKLALGHHFDDAVETFFMNLFNGGSLSCFAPKTYLSRKDLWVIRPLVFCEERDLSSLARRCHLPVVKSRCPADGNTERQRIKERIASLEGDYPDLRAKVMGALQRAGRNGWGADR